MGFEIGAVVQLNSPGSPTMTIERWADGKGEMLPRIGWQCAWFIQGALRRDVFPAETLKLYQSPAAVPA